MKSDKKNFPPIVWILEKKMREKLLFFNSENIHLSIKFIIKINNYRIKI